MSSEGISVPSSSESVVRKQVAPDQAKEGCAVSEHAQEQSQSVIPGCRANLDTMPQKSFEGRSSSNTNVCNRTDVQKRRSRWRQTETRHSPVRPMSSRCTRQSSRDRSLRREDSRRDSHRGDSTRKNR